MIGLESRMLMQAVLILVFISLVAVLLVNLGPDVFAPIGLR
jgi:hypothetical protein